MGLPLACDYIAWETQPHLASMATAATSDSQPAQPSEAEPNLLLAANANDSQQLSARALPLVLVYSAPYIAGSIGWFGLQVRCAAVCRSWRDMALDESCCAELALLRHSEEARWLHGHHSATPTCEPWQATARLMHHAELGWQNGGGRSKQFFGASGTSVMSIARTRAQGANVGAGAQTVIASSCFDGRVCVHRVHESCTRQPRVEALAELWHSPGGGPAPVDCCAVHEFSHEKEVLVASGSREQSVKIWRVKQDGSARADAPVAEWVGCGGRVMGVDTDGTVVVAGFQYAAATPHGSRFTSRFPQQRDPSGQDLHGNTPPIAAASVKPLRVWDIGRCGRACDVVEGSVKVGLPPKSQRHSVACVRWLGNNRVISANIRGFVHAFDLRASKTLVQTITTNQHGWAVLAMDAGYDASDSVFLSLADQRLLEYDWRGFDQPLRSAEVPERPARSLALDRCRRRMVTGGNENAGVVRFWDLDRWNNGTNYGVDPRRHSWDQHDTPRSRVWDGDEALCSSAMEGAHTDYISGVALCGLECWVSASLDGTLRAWQLP